MRIPDPNSTLTQLLDSTASQYPHRIFLHFEKQKISFRQFDKKARQLAAYLIREKGVRPGDKICLFAQNSPEFPLALMGVLKAGGVVVPVNIFFKSEELSHIMRDSESRLLLVTGGLLHTAKASYEELNGSFEILEIKKIFSGLKDEQEQVTPVPVKPEDLAALIYTSGTTGKPKGAMLTHRNFASNISGALQAIEMTHKDRFLVFLPLFHSFTLTVLLLLPMAIGARILLIGTVKSFKKIVKSFFLDRATLLAGIPHVYEALSHKKVPFMLRSLLKLRLCISGAAPLPEATLRQFEKNWKLPLLEGYGLSEASPVVSINPDKGVRKPLSVGLPLPNVKIKIAGLKGETLPANREGEVCVQGPNVMKGYYKQEEATRAVLKDNWLHTGDIGKLDEDGYLFIVDRKKDLILVRGMNVYPREIEEVLNHHPGIKECAVIGKRDEKRGEIPIAHIVLKPEKKVAEKELRDWCRSHLANYKVPHFFVFHEDLPKTSTGKILKRSLRE